MKKKTVDAKTYTLTRKAVKQAVHFGFTKDQIVDTFLNPKAVYPNKQHPGQWRVVNREICLVGVYNGDTFRVITMYRNGYTARENGEYAA
jgi:hypothetical protein